MPQDESSTDTWVSRSYPVEEDMRLQRSTWRIERLGWLGLAALVGAALAGLFGSGALSSRTATGADGRLEINYGRFERNGATTTMQVALGEAKQERVALRLNTPFLEAFTIQSVHPQPVAEIPRRDGAELVFAATRGAPLRIYFSLRPERIGPVVGEVAIAGSAPTRFTQFIYP